MRRGAMQNLTKIKRAGELVAKIHRTGLLPQIRWAAVERNRYYLYGIG